MPGNGGAHKEMHCESEAPDARDTRAVPREGKCFDVDSCGHQLIKGALVRVAFAIYAGSLERSFGMFLRDECHVWTFEGN
jgi:hypothetical protein